MTDSDDQAVMCDETNGESEVHAAELFSGDLRLGIVVIGGALNSDVVQALARLEEKEHRVCCTCIADAHPCDFVAVARTHFSALARRPKSAPAALSRDTHFGAMPDTDAPSDGHSYISRRGLAHQKVTSCSFSIFAVFLKNSSARLREICKHKK